MPRFSADGTRLFFLAASSETRNDLVSVALDGTGRRAHARFKLRRGGAVSSPDGRRLAFVSMDDVYVTDDAEALGRRSAGDRSRSAVMPLRTITRDGGGYLAWSGRRQHPDLVLRQRRISHAGRQAASAQACAKPRASRSRSAIECHARRARCRPARTLLRGARVHHHAGRRGDRAAATSS